ncbi:DUF2127 domain-containing protein [Veronia pacifica]|uniref:DUF2127 domain-containing protein n=1 Tax=Veronia pacifica TaxID=1080227 RepID=A0A1C3ESS4_9GAMM|nr:DUF2127 domain-containing protein [Veronia pacifica]ODA36311.1 hypothetical protein A8L45_00950 [Veronia pacifica]
MLTKKSGLKVVALLEAIKGLVSLIVGFGIHELAGQNIQVILENLLRHFHLNPANELPGILLEKASLLTPENLNLVVIGAGVYAIIRLVEAYGLWFGLLWTEWFALVSGAIYVPFEIYEVIQHQNDLSVAVLTINLAVVAYMYSVIREHKKDTENKPNQQ